MEILLKLSRWQEFVPWTLPLTLLGGLMAHQFADATLDAKLIVILLANFLAMAFAFIINDIEDADDDGYSPERGARNAVTSGDITINQARGIAAGTALLSALLYAAIGDLVFVTGIVILILSFLYSWKPVRLKALPIVDILSHILMLSALLLLAAYFAYDEAPREVLLVTVAMALLSGYGQFYNQVRDYEEDRAAGLNNTASILGQRTTELAGYFSIGIAAICLISAAVLGAFPLWTIGVLFLGLIIMQFVSSGRDMRGDEVADASGDIQVQFVFAANMMLVVWYFAVLLSQ